MLSFPAPSLSYIWYVLWFSSFNNPFLLSNTTGKDCLEPLTDFSWSIFSGIYFGIHQMFILQPLAIVSPTGALTLAIQRTRPAG